MIKNAYRGLDDTTIQHVKIEITEIPDNTVNPNVSLCESSRLYIYKAILRYLIVTIW